MRERRGAAVVSAAGEDDVSAYSAPLRLEIGPLDHVAAEVSVEHSDAGEPRLKFGFVVAGISISASADLTQETADAIAVHLIRGGAA